MNTENHKEWFEKHGNSDMVIDTVNGFDMAGFTVEEMFKMFEARIISNLVGSFNNDLQEK